MTVLTHEDGINGEIIELNEGKVSRGNFGIALDIGTTTLVMQLCNVETGEVVVEESDYNSQISCGDDIINRIIYASKNEGLERLRSLVLKSINGMISRGVAQTGIDLESISCIMVAGNTTMCHLFLGLEPKFIREEPYS